MNKYEYVLNKVAEYKSDLNYSEKAAFLDGLLGYMMENFQTSSISEEHHLKIKTIMNTPVILSEISKDEITFPLAITRYFFRNFPVNSSVNVENLKNWNEFSERYRSLI